MGRLGLQPVSYLIVTQEKYNEYLSSHLYSLNLWNWQINLDGALAFLPDVVDNNCNYNYVCDDYKKN